MGGNRIMRGDAARRVLAGWAVLALAAGVFGGCGGGGGSPGTLSEKEADGEVLNAAIARELTLVAAYEHGLALPTARPTTRAARRRAALLRQFRAHAQEHIDALTKAMRGLGRPVEAEAEPLDYAGADTWRKFLALAYDLETRTLRAHLTEISKLFHPWPRTLLGSIAAGEAQHLVLIRQQLGARTPQQSVPSAFESGATEGRP